MKKKIAIFLTLTITVVFAYSAQLNLTAPPAPPQEPPPVVNDCSPGYWKNHTEVWFGEGCSLIDDQTLWDMLSPEWGAFGGRDREAREAAAYDLNTCAAVVPNCEDDGGK